jgi:hypothetical protein
MLKYIVLHFFVYLPPILKGKKFTPMKLKCNEKKTNYINRNPDGCTKYKLGIFV